VPESSEPAQPHPGRPVTGSRLRPLLAVVGLLLLFVVVAAGTAGIVLWSRGDLRSVLKRPPEKSPESGSPASSPSPKASGALGIARKTNPPPPIPSGPDRFESALGYRATVPPNWTVVTKATGTSDSDGNFDAFSNNQEGENFGYLQVASVGGVGMNPLRVAEIVASNAASKQGYSIMVRPQASRFSKYEAANFRAYTVQNGYPLVVEVYIVASPKGDLLQIQFSAGFEGFGSQTSALASFEQSFEFAEKEPATDR
jgi:hypothetical protein